MPSRFVQNYAAALALAATTGLAACASPDAPRLETAADSLAHRLVEASGGLAAWDAVPAVRFDWVVRTDSAELRRVRHLWDKAGDRARVEWPVGVDSTMVAVIRPGAFTPDAPGGLAALTVGGATTPLSGDDALDALRDAHARWVNDTYWMIAPLKTFDPGVTRALAPDSGDATLALSFGRVGLTPGDRYWLRVGPGGEMTGWTYLLEGDTVSTRWTWAAPAEVPVPGGRARVWARKRNADGVEIVTRPLDLPALDDAAFESLAPRLD